MLGILLIFGFRFFIETLKTINVIVDARRDATRGKGIHVFPTKIHDHNGFHETAKFAANGGFGQTLDDIQFRGEVANRTIMNVGDTWLETTEFAKGYGMGGGLPVIHRLNMTGGVVYVVAHSWLVVAVLHGEAFTVLCGPEELLELRLGILLFGLLLGCCFLGR